MKRSVKNKRIQSVVRARAKGQTMVIVGLLLGLGVLVGLVAIAVDGGSALLQRRNMQNGADSASLGAAHTLAASVAISGNVPIFLITNAGLVSNVESLLSANRGGTSEAPTYKSTLEYGHYYTATGTYQFTVTARYAGATWAHESGYPANSYVPVWVDAVRVTAGMDNPTTFARAIGIDDLAVEAKAAAAIVSAGEDYVPQGPTWPMTTIAQTPTPGPGTGICNPYLFWSNPGGNFKNLVQLGAWQGASWEGAHPQLLTEYDPRGPQPDATGDDYYSDCVGAGHQVPGLWSPKGNCSPADGSNGVGDYCCTSSWNNAAPEEVANFITNDFTGRISLDSTCWDDGDGNCVDYRSDYNSSVEGDWLEAYNGGNFGNAIQTPIYNYIRAHGTNDDLAPFYGKHVDKVMYLYDLEEKWDRGDHTFCNPHCPFEWQPTDSNETPNRVHMAQAVVFRFYEQMASTGGFSTPASRCGVSQSFNTSNSKVYGVFVGAPVQGPLPPGGGHGTYNYVGFIP